METIYANKSYHEKEQAALMRKSITLCPDYDYCLENERLCPVDMEDLRDKHGLPIAMPELEEWQREICGLIIDVNVGEEVAFDWEDYHKRGIELAKRLRERLSTEYDLWYEAPAEDQSGTIKERMLILYCDTRTNDEIINTMDKKTTLYWQEIIKKAEQGDWEALKLAMQEYDRREEDRLPTIISEIEESLNHPKPTPQREPWHLPPIIDEWP